MAKYKRTLYDPIDIFEYDPILRNSIVNICELDYSKYIFFLNNSIIKMKKL